MRELNKEEINNVNGGIIPLLIIAAKGFAVGFGIGATAFGLYFAARSAK
ncbi:MAG: class IIb bacteriocin, lactobin A/cerein 7B family [Aliivibrio sp.]|nr:class IIb bacteriocin, lactobin A/cerein 7B family [Aliivibrio sp.]